MWIIGAMKMAMMMERCRYSVCGELSRWACTYLCTGCVRVQVMKDVMVMGGVHQQEGGGASGLWIVAL